jgi:hypothetical protein
VLFSDHRLARIVADALNGKAVEESLAQDMAPRVVGRTVYAGGSVALARAVEDAEAIATALWRGVRC